MQNNVLLTVCARIITNNTRFLSDIIHSCTRSEVTEARLHEVDLPFECVLIRDGQAALPCWFPKSDIQSIVNYICTMWCVFREVFLYVSFGLFYCLFLHFLCVFCIFFFSFFRVPRYELHNKSIIHTFCGGLCSVLLCLLRCPHPLTEATTKWSAVVCRVVVSRENATRENDTPKLQDVKLPAIKLHDVLH